MTFNDLSMRYRTAPRSYRFLIAALLGLLPGCYLLFTDYVYLTEDIELAQNERNVALKQFERAKRQASDLPKLQDKLLKTELELKEASKKLPDQFHMDRVLQKTALTARDVGVKLNLFDPGTGSPSETAYKFLELPIHVEINGTYSQIASFYDRMTHLDLLIHVKNIAMSLSTVLNTGQSLENKNDPSQNDQRNLRSHTRIKSTADIVIYRTLTNAEAATLDKKNKSKKIL